MNCRRLQDLLSAYLEGELGPAGVAECDAHLRTCPDCASLMSAAREIRRSLSGFPELEASPSLLLKLRGLPEKSKKARFRLDFLVKPSLQPVYAAATVLLVIISFYAFNAQNRRAVNKAVSRQFHIGCGRVEKLLARAEGITDGMGAYRDDLLDSLKSFQLLR
ncbi:MAG TPA: zf-HC2 domain-containing protein, partial [Candidatus Aminicenantes bacterium]|nr:zf-HC2 domain-containing protein [Candidatus Aminicenantes bacterium]